MLSQREFVIVVTTQLLRVYNWQRVRKIPRHSLLDGVMSKVCRFIWASVLRDRVSVCVNRWQNVLYVSSGEDGVRRKKTHF